MKLTVKEKEIKFPCLMVSEKGLIVLFSDKCIGTVLRGVDGYDYGVGCVSTEWNISEFTPFGGILELSNY